jgi:hypothetical protein
MRAGQHIGLCVLHPDSTTTNLECIAVSQRQVRIGLFAAIASSSLALAAELYLLPVGKDRPFKPQRGLSMENFASKVRFKNVCATMFTIPTLAAFLLALACSFNAQAAETKSITYTTNEGPVVSRAVLSPGDRPGHDLVQVTRTNMTSSADSDWNDSPVTTFGQSDVTNGTGTIAGYAVRTHKNGDKTYYRYHGTTKAVGDGNTRESVGEGALELIGGTGKFANATGTGTFSARGGVVTVKLTVTY